EGHNIRVGHKCRRVFVFDPDGGPGKDEAIVLCGPRIAESRVAPVAAKGADADQWRLVDHGIAEQWFPHALSLTIHQRGSGIRSRHLAGREFRIRIEEST